MKRMLAVLLALLLTAAMALAEDTVGCTWQMEEGQLLISVRTTSTDALSWFAAVTDRDMLTPVSEEFEADVTGFDTADTMGTWVTAWQPVEDAAGITEVSLKCQARENDEPAESWLL